MPEKEYIEREALIKRLEVSPLLKPTFSFGENIRSGIIDLVKRQLTADVSEVKHGEWIWTESGEEDYEQYWICSCCGDKSYIEENFCPNCGAKMDRGNKNGK